MVIQIIQDTPQDGNNRKREVRIMYELIEWSLMAIAGFMVAFHVAGI